MEKKSVFLNLDRTQVAEEHKVPETNMIGKFVSVIQNEERTFNEFMSVELPEEDLTLRRSEHKKGSTSEKRCKEECKGCKVRLNKETSDIVN